VGIHVRLDRDDENPGMSASSGTAARRRPRPSPLRSLDPVWLLTLNAVVIGYMWVRHGGVERAADGDEWLVGIGQISGLYAALAVLAGLVLVSRAPWLERRYGMDQMLRAHRLVGFAAAWLVLLHVVSVTVGLARAAEISLGAQIADYWRNYDYLDNAIIGSALLVLAVIASIRAVRRTLPYEAWWLVHLLLYAVIALAFGHQTAIGADFVLDSWAFAYWVALYLSVTASILLFRWGPLVWRLITHRTLVTAREQEASDVVTLQVGGSGVERIPAQAGQFFLLRVLRRGRWWKAHPFSVSAPPDGSTLRFTVKALGDDTTALQTAEPGTRVVVEGPFGGFLDVLPTDRKTLFIAGGIGITPFRGLIEEIPCPEEAILLYRTPTLDDAVFGSALHRLSAELGFRLHVSPSRGPGAEPNPFDPGSLRRMAPDLAQRDTFVIGSPRLTAAATRGLRAAGVPAARIHLESFAY
jgi:predicted ferric reductase